MQTTQDNAIAHIRSFNRFYTHMLGLLNQHILHSEFSLTEARVLLEINKSNSAQANALADRLAIDRSFFSRIVKRFTARGLVVKSPSVRDSRAIDLALTPAGQAVLSDLDARAIGQMCTLIQGFSPAELDAVQDAMTLIRDLFSNALYPVHIRGYAPGDAQYIIRRHEALYAQEYGLDHTFAAMVDALVTRFAATFDPARECVLIPEMHGQRMGSIAIARADDATAQLRFFLLEPEARGLGIGLKLVEEALAFARSAGYSAIFLETISILTSARALYKRAGFALQSAHPQRLWGRDVVEERWFLRL